MATGGPERVGPVVGFDLDMTLIDTVPGFVATLTALGVELGLDLPAAELTSRLGPPLEQLLAPYVPADRLAHAGDRFRAIYPDLAVTSVDALPGAHAALAAVRRHGGRTVLVTGKFPENARRHVDHLGLDVDHVEGWVWGVGKAAALRREGATVYVGDHVHDVEGARAAGAVSVSVLTGGCTRAELEAAGTDVVLTSLEEFAEWYDDHLLDVRLAALDHDLRALGRVVVAADGGAGSALLLAAAVRALGPARVVACSAPPSAEPGPPHVVTGATADDAVTAGRAGVRAAAEPGVVTPLRDVGLTREQVRAAARRWGLATGDQPT